MNRVALTDHREGGLALLRSQHLMAVMVRFGFIGGINAVVFFAGTWLGIKVLGWSAVGASLLGYGLSMPVGFFGHRRVSFRSTGHPLAEALRFGAVQAINIGITVATMAGVVDRLRLGWMWGGMGVVVLVPIANFVLARLWVFRRKP